MPHDNLSSFTSLERVLIGMCGMKHLILHPVIDRQHHVDGDTRCRAKYAANRACGRFVHFPDDTFQNVLRAAFALGGNDATSPLLMEYFSRHFAGEHDGER